MLDFPDELFAHGLPSLPTLLHLSAVRGGDSPGDPEQITNKSSVRLCTGSYKLRRGGAFRRAALLVGSDGICVGPLAGSEVIAA